MPHNFILILSRNRSRSIPPKRRNYLQPPIILVPPQMPVTFLLQHFITVCSSNIPPGGVSADEAGDVLLAIAAAVATTFTKSAL